MSSTQCVPSWDLDDAVPTTRPHAGSSSGGPDVPMLDYEVAELTWENGQLSMHGLGLPRASSKPCLKQYACAMGTLESIVGLATQKAPPPPPKDALVPCETGVDSCSGAAAAAAKNGDEASVLKRAPRVVPVAAAQWNREQSVSGSGGTLGADSWHVPTVDTCEKELGGFGLTSTSFCSQGNTFSSSGRPATTNNDDHDSVCHSRPQREAGNEEDEERKRNGKSSSSTRRSRAAAIHNQSERKRRDKINQKMKMLQKLVPNSNKTDKASMLDEVIDYLKQLQAQVHMMSRMSVPSMMMPQLAMQQQQLQMSMMAAAAGMGLGAMPAMPPMDMSNMGMSMGMNMNMAGMATRPNPMAAFMPMAGPWDVGAGDARLPSQAVVPTDPISTYLACQPQPMTVEGYSRMIALIQQQQQQLASVSKHQ